MDAQDMQKLIRSENARLRGWKRKLNKKTDVLCRGGPFDGQRLFLSDFDRTSARFRVGDFYGRYIGGRWVGERE